MVGNIQGLDDLIRNSSKYLGDDGNNQLFCVIQDGSVIDVKNCLTSEGL